MTTINAAVAGATQFAGTPTDTRLAAEGAAYAQRPARGSAAPARLDESAETSRSAGSLSGDDMKARLIELIQGQVDSGAIEADEAAALQRFFAHRPSEDHAGALASGDKPAAERGTISEAASMKLDALEGFLDRLRQSQGASASGYGSSPPRQGPGRTGLVLDSLS